MPFITQGKTNWKFLLVVIILAIIVGAGALWYSAKQRFSSIQSPGNAKTEMVTKNVPSETDLGYDIYKKGVVKGYIKETEVYYKGNFLKDGFYELEDYCYVGHPKNPSPSGDHLKEYILVNNETIFFGDRECNCLDGACIKPADVSICTETDGGKDIYTKGKVTGIHDAEGFISESEDRCENDGSMILENFCTAGLNYDYAWISCEAGCEDGKCLKGIPTFLPKDWPINKCYDSDGGKNYYQKGETYGNYNGDDSNVFVVSKDVCQNENQLNEGFCLNDRQSSGIGIECPCVDGACVQK